MPPAPAAPVGVGEHGNRPGLGGGCRERDAVAARSGQRGVQVTGPDPLRAQREAGDLDAVSRPDDPRAELRGQHPSAIGAEC